MFGGKKKARQKALEAQKAEMEAKMREAGLQLTPEDKARPPPVDDEEADALAPAKEVVVPEPAAAAAPEAERAPEPEPELDPEAATAVACKWLAEKGHADAVGQTACTALGAAEIPPAEWLQELQNMDSEGTLVAFIATLKSPPGLPEPDPEPEPEPEKGPEPEPEAVADEASRVKNPMDASSSDDDEADEPEPEKEPEEEPEEEPESEYLAPTPVEPAEPEGDKDKPASTDDDDEEVPSSADEEGGGGDLDKSPAPSPRRPKTPDEDPLVFDIGCGTAVIHSDTLGVVAYGPDSSGRAKLRWEDGSISGFVTAKELLPPSEAEAARGWVADCWVLGRVAPG